MSTRRKLHHDHIAAETRRIGALIVKDPVAAVAKGHVMNFITDVEQATQEIDVNLTNIMMAQDFHDLTGQVVAKVVSLVSDVGTTGAIADPDCSFRWSDQPDCHGCAGADFAVRADLARAYSARPGGRP